MFVSFFFMQEKSYSKKSYSDNTLEEESISLLEWDSLKTHLSSFASTEMGKQAILSFGIPSEYQASKRLLNETVEINELENRLNELHDYKKNTIYVVCRSGNRSGLGKDILNENNFTAVNVDGGMLNWKVDKSER